MIWVLLFIPLSIWLGIRYISQLNIQSAACLALTLVIFTLIELRQVLRDKNRVKTPLYVMCLSVVSIIIGILWK